MKPKLQRKFDSVYDTTFTVSDKRDLYRDVQRNNPAEIQKVSNYSNMFSESRLHPSYSYRMKQEEPKVFPSTGYLQSGKNQEPDVKAARWKYHTRPLLGQTHLH